jgi:hypothetical protein
MKYGNNCSHHLKSDGFLIDYGNGRGEGIFFVLKKL